MTRKSFNSAGQDSFTQAPAQNPDMFTVLNNVEPVTEGNLQRRRGYASFQAGTPGTPFDEMFSFRNDATGIRRIVFTSPQEVFTTDEQGNGVDNPLFTPSLTAQTVRMVLSRNFGYFADGVAADYLKWDGTTITNWGIAVNSSPATVNGPNANASTTNGTVPPWPSNPAAVVTTWVIGPPDTATIPASSSQTISTPLIATNFGFGLPGSAIVTGIQLDITGSQDNPGPSTAQSAIVPQLTQDGSTAIGSGPSPGFLSLPATTGGITFGGPTETWGVNLTGADVNSATFGVGITAAAGGLGSVSPTDFTINTITMTIYVSGSSIVLGSPTGTGITVLNGRVYTVAFENVNTGTVSDIFPFSASTGPLTDQGQPLSGIPVSSDPQVTNVLLLATLDGGDETTLYLVTSLPNGTTTYTDIMPDTQLELQNIYQQSDQSGNLFGIVNNLIPPPGMLFPVKHKGRIYGVIGPTLHFSKSLSDVTTSTGTITSKWEEAWPATYTIDISELAETVSALLSDGQTLWIGTDASIRRLNGDGPSNFSEPEVVFNETGVINPDVWKIVFAEGQPVGSMWLTPDNRVMFSDFNTYTDIGTPIQNVLNSVNRNVVQSAAHACFVSLGPSEYYMLYLPTGSSTVPNVVCVYNMRAKLWSIWTPSLDTVTASLYNISANGTPQWLFSTGAGPGYFWDSGNVIDRNLTMTGAFYPVTITTSWLDFGDEGLTKAFNKIIAITGDTLLTVGVQGAIRQTDLAGVGTTVIAATPVMPSVFGDLFVPMVAQPGYFRWYKITFTSPASAVKDVLNAFDFEINPSLRM